MNDKKINNIAITPIIILMPSSETNEKVKVPTMIPIIEDGIIILTQ